MKTVMKFGFRLVLTVYVALARLADAQEMLVANPTRHEWRNALVRVNPDRPLPAEVSYAQVVTHTGEELPTQLERLADGRGLVWVALTLGPGESKTLRVIPGREPAPRFIPRVRQENGAWLIANDHLQLRLPAQQAPDGTPPAPISAYRIPGGEWRGKGMWLSAPICDAFEVEVLAAGPLFGKIRLHYRLGAGRSTVDITLPPDRPFALIEESHTLREGDAWRLDLAEGWKPSGGLMRRWYTGPFQAAPPEERFPLRPGHTRLGNTIVELLPRWTQSYDEGWTFGVFDDRSYAGALVVRAGDWRWPHDNAIAVRVREAGDWAALDLPAHRGRRTWLLLAGESSLAARLPEIARDESFLRPDKLVHQYRLPVAPGEKNLIGGVDFYSNQTNPTAQLRQQNRNRVREAAAGKTDHSLGTLYLAQAFFDPDWYGLYEHGWSPINPNFYTDFIRGGIALAAQLRGHPEFEHVRKLAEEAFRRDMDHSITLPGGAGQECPGYQEHAMGNWRELAPVCAQYLGFDPRTWPRYREGARFLARTSVPEGPGNRVFHPIGDTHPGKPNPIAWAADFGVSEDPRGWGTEEFPGFGVVFRNRSGTDRESFLSFKAGPNRGHYHGDQLSIHWAANARPLAVDHHASYKPRPGQEHMHNRLSFRAGALAYANMDGHERLIAFRPGDLADVAVGRVESGRLRAVNALPPEDWDVDFPQVKLKPPLVYQRTIVFLKGETDVVVLLDTFEGPEVEATWNLHVRGDLAERDGDWIRFQGMSAWLAQQPGEKFDSLPWEHDNGGREKTTAARVTRRGRSGRFLSVLVPGSKRPDIAACEDGVRIGSIELRFGEDGAVWLVFGGKTQELLSSRDIDLNRSQGNIGLFIPDVGYPFGPLPEWLLRQRASVGD